MGEEDLLVVHVRLHAPQPFSDVRPAPGVHEGDAPVVHVASCELDAVPASGQREVVREGLVVGEEVLLDHLGLMPEADDELVVPEVCVVLHDVPQDRAAPDRHHRLRHALGRLPHPEPEPPAEEHDLHADTRRPCTGTRAARWCVVVIGRSSPSESGFVARSSAALWSQCTSRSVADNSGPKRDVGVCSTAIFHCGRGGVTTTRPARRGATSTEARDAQTR